MRSPTAAPSAVAAPIAAAGNLSPEYLPLIHFDAHILLDLDPLTAAPLCKVLHFGTPSASRRTSGAWGLARLQENSPNPRPFPSQRIWPFLPGPSSLPLPCLLPIHHHHHFLLVRFPLLALPPPLFLPPDQHPQLDPHQGFPLPELFLISTPIFDTLIRVSCSTCLSEATITPVRVPEEPSARKTTGLTTDRGFAKNVVVVQ